MMVDQAQNDDDKPFFMITPPSMHPTPVTEEIDQVIGDLRLQTSQWEVHQ